MTPKNHQESGVVLLNVLAVLAISVSVVMLMVALQQVSIARSQRLGEVAEADAIIRGGEAAAVAALRRAGTETPDSVHYGQSWAKLDETAAPMFGGTFTMRIVDAQARFNINALAHPNALALDHLRRIALRLGLPAGVADIITAHLIITGPIDRLDDLSGVIPGTTLKILNALTVALPEETRVNVNTADEQLLAVLLGNAGSARQLTAKRERQGELTPGDVADAKVLLPPDLGFSSNYFQTEIQVTFGDITEQLSSLLQRRRGPTGVVVQVIDRALSPASPIVPEAGPNSGG